jgi:serine/threonine protein kinase
MEFMHGVTSRDFLRRHEDEGRLPPVDISAFIISRVCRALAYAHDKRDRKGTPLGIVHRDVTPTNIMLDLRGFVKLMDFGIAKALTMSIPDETKVVMGKFPYMAPEQVWGRTTDRRTDIFALGLCLYELLTGERPLEAKSRKELIQKMSGRPIAPPCERRRIVPRALSDIVMKSLEMDPERRHADAREFGDALEMYMYGSGYGPTNEKLAEYLVDVFPEIDRDRIE